MRHVLGIDLGGTKVEACLLDGERHILGRSRLPAGVRLGAGHVLNVIHEVAQRAAEGRPIEAAGMGTAGTYIGEENRIFGAPHTPLYEEKGFIEKVRASFDVPVAVENDANCLALAEYFELEAGGFRNVMAVILGTGMGSGLILGGRLHRGGRGGAGEIGHATVDMHGRICECGRKGCPEAYLSGPSLSRRFFEMSGTYLPPDRIWKLYQAGDRMAEALFSESCGVMAESFANAVNVLDLDVIVLGGGVSNIPLWYDHVPDLMRPCLFGPPRKSVPVLKAKLGDSAGVVGAAYLALRELGLMVF